MKLFNRMGRLARRRNQKRSVIVNFERCEDRFLLTQFLVQNFNDAGTGSLRQAIIDSNSAGGSNDIAFNIPDNQTNPEVYVITLTSAALPAITDQLTLDGTSESAFLGKPAIVQINGYNLRTDGLILGSGSSRSYARDRTSPTSSRGPASTSSRLQPATIHLWQHDRHRHQWHKQRGQPVRRTGQWEYGKLHRRHGSGPAQHHRLQHRGRPDR